VTMHPLIDHLFAELTSGRRADVRQLVSKLAESQISADRIIAQLLWPVLDHIQQLRRDDQISELAHCYATTALRMSVDLIQPKLKRQPRLDRRAMVISGHDDGEEVGAQMLAELLEASGFEVYFPGRAAPADELAVHLQQLKADVLAIFGQVAPSLPQTRQLIDQLRRAKGCGQLRVALGGGVFKRADGLAEQLGADLCSHDPVRLCKTIVSEFTTLDQQARDAA